MSNTKVVLLTGGAWWDGSSPANVGHHFVRQVVQNATERDRPLRLYICTRKPPPTGELERFVRAHEPQSHSGPHKLAPESPRTNNVELRHVPLDLLDPTSIRNCASAFLAQETKLDVLVLNAAIAPNKRESAGFVVPPLAERNEHSNEEPRELEKGMITNVIGTAMLAKLLEPALIKAAKDGEEKPRVVLVSSELHRKLGDLEVTPDTIQSLLSPEKWKGMQTYKLTKLIQTIWLFAIKRDYGRQIDCVAVSPGFIPSTSLSRASSFSTRLLMSYVLHFMPFASTVEEGGNKVYQASLEAIPALEHGDRDRTAVYLKDHAAVQADSRVYDEKLGDQWKRWIDHAIETLTTPVASLVSPSPSVLVVGGTAGIGASLARKLAFQLPLSSEITIAGRNSDAAAEVIASIRQCKSDASRDTGDQSSIAKFEKVDCARMNDVKRFCEQYSKHLSDTGRKLDILVLTPGILSMQGCTPAAPGSTLDLKMALHYYSRMLIIRELGASLAPEAIVMSVLDGKRSDAHDKAIKWDDLALTEPGHYSLNAAAKHCTAMTDVMMQDFASSASGSQARTFVHAYPGIVSTGIFSNTGLPFYARFFLGLLSKLFAISPEACADRLIDGMIKCHRSTIAHVGQESQSGHGSKWYNIGLDVVVDKVPVERAVVERVREHTWKMVDEQSAEA